MKALVWHGVDDVRVDRVPDPTILDPTDVIIRVTSTAICGSDLHLLNGFVPTMEEGDILGHEPMGVVVETGKSVKRLKVGDRVVVPFVIACGECFFCRKQLYSGCERTNPDHEKASKMLGHAGAGLFGFSHLTGGYPGGQAELLRVPHADFGLQVVESSLPDEKVLFLSDILPTGYMAAENAGIEPGDTVAVWGCGPVGQMAIQSAWLFNAGRVIAIDNVPERLQMAQKFGRAETINFDDDEVYDRLQNLTQGRGPDRCIDAVGCEAHPHGSVDAVLDNVKQKVKLGTDRAHALREAIYNCRVGGTVSVPGVYVGAIDKLPFGSVMQKGLTIKSGQTHVQKYSAKLLGLIEDGELDPSFIVTHRRPLDDAPEMYKAFREKKDGCVKVVLAP